MEKLRDYISFDLEFNKHQDKTHLIQVSAVRFKDGEEVSLETLFNKCLIKKGRDGVKVLGNGELNKKLTVKVHKISKSAKAAVEAKGGTVELVEVKGFERAETNK